VYVLGTESAGARGLYMVTMAIDNKPGTHYGILDAGNILRQFGAASPRIYHLRPQGLVWTTDLSRVLTVEKVEDERGAVARFQESLTRPIYSLLTNKCEHFARFVAVGDRSSGQAVLLGAASVVAAFSLVAALTND
jgi:hypothetical protein